LRIVTRLERRYPDFPGLNLTWEVREGIVKHESEYDVSDASEYNPELRGQLEAQIANAADELAYTAHDLDDGLRSGMITPLMLEGITLWEILSESVGWRGPTLDDLDRHRLIRRLIGIEVSDLVQTTHQRLQESGPRSAEEVQRLAYNVIGFSEDMHRRNRQLKDFLYAKLYRHHRVVRMAVKAERILRDLFNAYLQEPEILPVHVQSLIEEYGQERTICDYIAGMTDRFAVGMALPDWITLAMLSGEILPSIGPKAAALRAPAAAAMRPHSSNGLPSSKAHNNAASKQSPAPVGSTSTTE
jgi:dGTPase